MSVKKGFSSTEDVLQSLLKNGKSSLSTGFTRWKIWREWESVVGPSISSYSSPVGYKSGILYIWVKSSPLMQELIFLAPDMLRQVNKYVGKNWVRRIQFTLDQKDVPNMEDASDKFKKFIDRN